MTERSIMLKKLSAVQFAAHELHIYLDTHPDDTPAAAAMEEYDRQTAALKKEYESRFGPLSPGNDGNRWAWIADPWPWDKEER